MKVPIQRVGIIGAGTMGQGIAHAVAISGYQVILHDVNQSVLKKARNTISNNLDMGIRKGKLTKKQKDLALENIEVSPKLDQLEADLVIEAVVEDLKIKADLFKKLEHLSDSQTIFASNTSSIPITKIGSQLKIPGRLGGLHFFNPAHIMKLVEVIKGEHTDPGTIGILTEFTRSIGKVPVAVADRPGFIVNRVARHYYLESLKVLEDEVADHATIDDLLENFGFRMGPFRLMDLIGVDVNLAVTESIYKSFNRAPKFKPSGIQQQKVAAGQYGRKTGKGFYEYQ